MCVHLPFDYKKATQALNFFARKNGGHINKMKALKLVFFADRYHLRKYGVPITNDEYFAMKFGPVPSGVKDLAELDENFGTNLEYVNAFLERKDPYHFSSKVDVDYDEFSDTDIESLEFAWRTFKDFDKYDLADYTHAYPEWKKHEKALETLARVRMRFEDFFEDPPEGYEPCFELSSDQKECQKEFLDDVSKVEKLWA